jgi:hypothetical protein
MPGATASQPSTLATIRIRPSTSSAQTVTVSGKSPTTTALTVAGTAGNYTLTGTVSDLAGINPTGTVTFTDTTASPNATLGSGLISAGTLGLNFVNSSRTCAFQKIRDTVELSSCCCSRLQRRWDSRFGRGAKADPASASCLGMATALSRLRNCCTRRLRRSACSWRLQRRWQAGRGFGLGVCQGTLTILCRGTAMGHSAAGGTYGSSVYNASSPVVG